MSRSTKQQTASAPAERQSTGASRASTTTANPHGNGVVRSPNGNVKRPHDGTPGQVHPIFDELIAELGDPRRPA